MTNPNQPHPRGPLQATRSQALSIGLAALFIASSCDAPRPEDDATRTSPDSEQDAPVTADSNPDDDLDNAGLTIALTCKDLGYPTSLCTCIADEVAAGASAATNIRWNRDFLEGRPATADLEDAIRTAAPSC